MDNPRVPVPNQVPMIGGQRQQTQLGAARAQNNPVPSGDEGLAVLRGLSECPIPAESQKLNNLLSVLIKEKVEDDKIEQVMAKGLIAALRANVYCNNHLKARTACIFAEDDKLKKMHEDFLELEKATLELNAKLEENKRKVVQVLQERWNYAVKTYGLDVEKFSYRIDEEKGIIEQVDMQCLECKGSTRIRKARQETAELVMRLDQKKKEKNNDGGGKATEGSGAGAPEGAPPEDGESSPQE